MPSKSPTYPGPLTARGAVLAVLLSNEDQTGAEPLRGTHLRAYLATELSASFGRSLQLAAGMNPGRLTTANSPVALPVVGGDDEIDVLRPRDSLLKEA